MLAYDMVFTPHQPLLEESFGVGTALPRAVPADAVVAVLSTVVSGQVVQKVALLGALFFAALGAGRLLADKPLAVQLIAATAYVWNPYVAERLFIGHWPVLVAYAALPWIARAGLAVRAGEPGAWARLVLTTLPAALGPTGGLLAAGTGVAAVGPRKAWLPLGAGVLLNATWWLPGILHPAAASTDPAGVAAFAARSEHWGGELLTVLGLGGVWNADVVPDSRTSVLAGVVTLVVLAVAAVGLSRVERARRGLLWLGVLGLCFALLGAFAPTADALSWAAEHVPGASLLRDGTRFLAWLALPLVLAAALGVHRIVTAIRRRPSSRAPEGGGPERGVQNPYGAERHVQARVAAALTACAVALPIAVLPDLAWGGLGRLAPVTYPDDYAAVAWHVEQHPDDVLALPVGSYRRFDWNDRRPQLTPLPRWLPHTTLVADHLVVTENDRRLVVRGEDARAQRAVDALAAGRSLGALGVGWVAVEHTSPEVVDPALLHGVDLVHDGQDVSLYRVPGAIGTEPESDLPPAILTYLLYFVYGSCAVFIGWSVRTIVARRTAR